jgi:hypothetical protein
MEKTYTQGTHFPFEFNPEIEISQKVKKVQKKTYKVALKCKLKL